MLSALSKALGITARLKGRKLGAGGSTPSQFILKNLNYLQFGIRNSALNTEVGKKKKSNKHVYIKVCFVTNWERLVGCH